MMSIQSLQIELYNDNECSFSVSSSAFPDVLLFLVCTCMHIRVYPQMFLNVSHAQVHTAYSNHTNWSS